jgi:hypothetical protein
VSIELSPASNSLRQGVLISSLFPCEDGPLTGSMKPGREIAPDSGRGLPGLPSNRTFLGRVSEPWGTTVAKLILMVVAYSVFPMV